MRVRAGFLERMLQQPWRIRTDDGIIFLHTHHLPESPQLSFEVAAVIPNLLKGTRTSLKSPSWKWQVQRSRLEKIWSKLRERKVTKGCCVDTEGTFRKFLTVPLSTWCLATTTPKKHQERMLD